MAEKSISNDELGAAGEAHFAKLCASAGLVANKSDRDKMGWDFFVERKPEDDRSRSLDHRLSAPACRVQVKTIWKRDEDRVTLTLATAERLAKPGDPAFVVVFQVEDGAEDIEFVAASLIHIRGKHLARILKRLRSASAGRTHKKLGDQEVSFSAGNGRSFETGRELAAALQELAGDDAEAYRLAKHEEMSNLGFDGPRYSVDIAFQVEDRDHFFDALLGKREIEVRAADATELRFDIPLPVEHIAKLPDGHRMVAKFRPMAEDCTIVVRSANGNTPIRFEGTGSQLPLQDVSDADSRMLFSTDVFELEVRGNGHTALTIGGSQITDTSLPVSSWRNLCGLVAMLGAGAVTFEISHPSVGPIASVPWSTATEPEQVSWASKLDGLLGRIEELAQEAGSQLPHLTGHEMVSAGGDIDVLHRFWQGALFEPAVFPIDAITSDDPAELKLVRALSAALGNAHIAVAELLSMSGAAEDTGFVFRQHDRRIARVEDIGHEVDAIEAFTERVRVMTGAHGSMLIANT